MTEHPGSAEQGKLWNNTRKNLLRERDEAMESLSKKNGSRAASAAEQRRGNSGKEQKRGVGHDDH